MLIKKKIMKYIYIFTTVGCTSVTNPQFSTKDFEQLHKKVYSVYQVPLEPNPIHNLLSSVFLGEALTKEYVEHYTARVHMKKDTTDIEIRQIDYNEVVMLSKTPDLITVDVDWSVGGIVTHQKHKHPRVNRYRAIFSLEVGAEQVWKIMDTKMKNAQRIQRAGIRDVDFFEGKKNSGGYLDPMDLIDAGVFDEDSD